jgi:molybdate transport system permease protein
LPETGTILQKIVLPLAWPGVGAGALLAFARSLGEFGATLMLAGNIPGRTQTVPIALFFHVEAGAMREAWMMAAALMFVSITAVLVMRRIELSVRS